MTEYDNSADLQRELNNGQKIMKYVLIVFNVIFLIFGCVLCAVGSYAMNSRIQTLGGNTLPAGIIVMGVFLLVMSLVGILSAWKELRIGLGIYFVLLLVLSILLISIGIAVYVKKDDSPKYISNGWSVATNETKTLLQNTFGCCGLSKTTDVNNAVTYVDYVKTNVCPPMDGTSTLPTCGDALQTEFNNVYGTAGTCGIVFAVLMIIALIFVCYLMSGIRAVGMNQAIAKNREKTQKAKEKRRKKGKGLKTPSDIL